MPDLPEALGSLGGPHAPDLRDQAADVRRPRDLRALALGVSAWAGALVALALPGWAALGVLALGVAALLLRVRHERPVATGAACLLAAAAVGVGCAARAETHRTTAVAVLAQQGAAVTLSGRVTSDPARRPGRFGTYTLTRVTVSEVVGRGRQHRTAVPILVIGDESWVTARLGARVEATGRLGPASGPDLAGVLSTGRPPRMLGSAPAVFDGAARIRSGIRESVSSAPPDARALVPALVVGDDQQMSPSVVADFRTCGLTHLAAVSGTNLTLVVGFVLILARWAGVRARGLTLIGLVGVVGFVLLARPEPSVLRAAVMGSVALLGMGSHGRERGVRALGAAVLGLLLVDPWLARSLGFALSSLATAGILFLGPTFRDALGAWMPRWAAEALAVPFAAQLACTPVVAAISGQVSLVAVMANLAVAAAVGPATVLGLLGGLVVLVAPPVGHVCGWLAGLCGGWIVTVAVHLARLPTAAVDWPTGAVSVGLLAVVCLVIALGAGPVLRKARWSLALSALLVVVLLRPLPSPGWPPRGWVLAVCDVGQGDGVVVNAGAGSALVVDAGPEPAAIDGCLRRLEVRSVPVVVLTHFHADHIDGLPGVLEHPVREIEVTGVADPAAGAEQVHRWSAAAGVPVRVPAFGEVRRLGAVTWQVIGPQGSAGAADEGSGNGEEGSAANDASLVLLVEVAGVRMLLTGDIEPGAQAALERTVPGLQVDVLKVPHHGSRYQDAGLLSGLGARLALVSVGADNDYGHPAEATLMLLRRAGMSVHRTDEAGDVAVTVQDGRLRVHERGSH